MFWEKFVMLCNQINKSPNAVCADLKFSNATATHWKQGAKPNSSTLQKIADYFNVNVSYFSNDTKEKPGTEVTPPELNDDLKNITEILKSLPPEKVKEIENYALFVLKQQNQ